MKKTYYCPICDFTCPYCIGRDFHCVIGDPMAECDDYYAYMCDEEEEDDENA